MLYEIMLIGIGFLSASLCMAALAPLIHARAVRLTVRRVLKGLPRSMVEMRAQKDQLRAESAVAVRRLEVTIADMQAKTALHWGEVARKAAEIDRLKTELRRAHVTILRFQERELLRTMVKLAVYLYERWQRGREHAVFGVTRGLDPRVHLLRRKMDCTELGLARVQQSKSAASRVYPTCSVKPGK
jgi:uncharacterized small protein (DUF1192 family)